MTIGSPARARSKRAGLALGEGPSSAGRWASPRPGGSSPAASRPRPPDRSSTDGVELRDRAPLEDELARGVERAGHGAEHDRVAAQAALGDERRQRRQLGEPALE